MKKISLLVFVVAVLLTGCDMMAGSYITVLSEGDFSISVTENGNEIFQSNNCTNWEYIVNGDIKIIAKSNSNNTIKLNVDGNEKISSDNIAYRYSYSLY